METNLSDFPSKPIEVTAGVAAPAARRWLSSPVWQALGYLLALTTAEVVTTLIDPRVGLILHGIVLVALISHASLTLGRLQGGFLIALAFASLIRLLSLTTPLLSFPKIYWYLIIGAPLLLAAFLARRISHLEQAMIGMRITWRGLPGQVLIGATGLGLGLLEYLILRPAPLAERLTFQDIFIPALILLIFTGFLEEYIFRGLMQYTATRSLGRFGLLYVALVFAVLHIGYKSILDVIFVFAVAVYFSYMVTRTGTLLGVTLAHGMTNITLFLVFPFLAGQLYPDLGGFKPPAALTPAPGIEQTQALPIDTAIPSPDSTASPMQPPLATASPTQPLASATSTSLPQASPTLAVTSTMQKEEASPTVTYTQTEAPTPTQSVTPIQPTPSATPSPVPTLAPTLPPTSTAKPALTSTPAPSPTQAIDQTGMVDDGDAGFVTRGVFNSSTMGMFGDMHWVIVAKGEASAEAEWQYPYQTCGRYQIEVYIPTLISPEQAATQFALYQVGHRYGLASHLVDQSAYPGKWVSLGEWEFLPAGGSYVRLTNATGEDPVSGLRVLFDAVRWRFTGDCQ